MLIVQRQVSRLHLTCFVPVPSLTLSSIGSRLQRRNTVQLNLAFLELPSPSAIVWEALDEEQRVAALHVLARLIAQAAQDDPGAEGNDND